jgi:tetratricopeptide (TPR) repeat protein
MLRITISFLLVTFISVISAAQTVSADGGQAAEGTYTYDGVIALGHAQYMAKKFDVAIAKYKEAKAMDAGRPESYYFTGCAMIQKKMFAEAVASFKVSAEISGEKNPVIRAKSLFAAGIAWEMKRDFKMAKSAFSEYLDFAKLHTDANVFIEIAEQKIDVIEKWEQRVADYQLVKDKIVAESTK